MFSESGHGSWRISFYSISCCVHCSDHFKSMKVWTLQIWASEEERRTSDSCKVSDRMRFSVLSTIYGSWKMIKLLDLRYLVLCSDCGSWKTKRSSREVALFLCRRDVLYPSCSSLSRKIPPATYLEQEHLLLQWRALVTSILPMSASLKGYWQ